MFCVPKGSHDAGGDDADGVDRYASIARGYRGGGFNAPTAPTRTYKGDSVWDVYSREGGRLSRTVVPRAYIVWDLTSDGNVLATSSRDILKAGPDPQALRLAVDSTRAMLAD